MATTTKKTTRKAPVKKATTAKKPAVKKAPAKAVASKTTVRTVKKAAPRTAKKTTTMMSFHATRQAEPFFTFRVTHQTIYWLILAFIVVGLAVWVLSISIRVQNIYDQIDATNSRAMNMIDIAEARTN